MKLIVDGIELDEEVTGFLVDELMRLKAIENPEEAQAFLTDYTIEPSIQGMFFRNPDFDGLHFFAQTKHEGKFRSDN